MTRIAHDTHKIIATVANLTIHTAADDTPVTCTSHPSLTTRPSQARAENAANGWDGDPLMCAHCCDTLDEHRADAQIAAAWDEAHTEQKIRQAIASEISRIGLGCTVTQVMRGAAPRIFRDAYNRAHGIHRPASTWEEDTTHCILCGRVETVPGVCDNH